MLAVVYPMRSRNLRTSCNAWKASVLVWVILLVMNILESVDFLKQLNNHTRPTCFESYESAKCPLEGIRLRVIQFMIVILVTMLLVNIVCTTMVFRTLHGHLSGDSPKINNKMNVMLIFAINLILYAIFLPVPITMAMDCAHVKPLICLTVLNCCLDPLLYYFSFDAFWKKKEDVV